MNKICGNVYIHILSHEVDEERVHPLVTKISTSSGIYCREAKRYQKSIFRFAGKLAPLNKCLQKKVKFIALADEWENKELLQSCYTFVICDIGKRVFS